MNNFFETLFIFFSGFGLGVLFLYEMCQLHGIVW